MSWVGVVLLVVVVGDGGGFVEGDIVVVSCMSRVACRLMTEGGWIVGWVELRRMVSGCVDLCSRSRERQTGCC